MTEERQTLKAGVQYNHFKGSIAIDEAIENDSPIYTLCDDDKKLIGWTVGKYDYDAPIRVKLMMVDENTFDELIQNGERTDDARIYVKEIDVSVEEFLNFFGRFEVMAIKGALEPMYGEEYTFVHED